LHDRVESALVAIEVPAAVTPSLDDYLADYGDGVALLRSAAASVDLHPAAEATLLLMERLEIERVSPQAVIDGLLGEPAPGAVRWLGWRVARRHLQPVLAAFAVWRAEDRWQRSHCPACGALPAMGQLIGVDPGYMRFLSCGCCGTRWRWRRTACPFCQDDPHRLEVVKIDAEPELRIDHCATCKGYLKTYVGRGDEGVMLADWTSLHLDLVARDRGLERKAQSLYDLGALLEAPQQS
jgi:FdhE protein